MSFLYFTKNLFILGGMEMKELIQYQCDGIDKLKNVMFVFVTLILSLVVQFVRKFILLKYLDICYTNQKVA